LASDQSSPPYSPEVVNANWTAFDTPAVAMAIDWEELYLAWTDPEGAVRLASTTDGWTTNIVVAKAGSAATGPALLVADDRLYVAWLGRSGALTVATCDRNNNVQTSPSDIKIFSRPTLAWAPGQLYALSGGNTNGQGELALRVFVSQDHGWSFTSVDVEINPTFGPPAMAIVEGQYHLVWADANTLRLCYTVTDRLDEYVVTYYSDGCHGGGPAILGLPEGITLGWSYGAPVEDSRLHHIALAQEPLAGGATALDKERFAKLARVGAPNPCPDPLTVYNPATGKCVPRGGCIGGCVLQSFNLAFGYPVFNPIKYAMCVISCEKKN
jgi:hypothetical protein